MTFNVIDSYGYATSPTTFARIVDAAGSDAANFVHVDSSGNSYLCGYYASTTPRIITTSNSNVSVTVATLPAPSGTASDGFCSKFDSNGNYQYSILMRGTTLGEASYSATTDSSNNLYVIGTAVGQSNIAIVSNSNVMTTLSNIFVNTTYYVACASKFSPTGTYLYSLVVYHVGGNNFGTSGTCDVDGNVYLCGTLGGSIAYYSNSNVQTVIGTISPGGGGACKFNSSGAYQGSIIISGVMSNISSDIDKNVYVGGYAAEGSTVTVSVLSSSNVSTTVGSFSITTQSGIACKFDPSLSYQYSLLFSKNGTSIPTTTRVYSIACDSAKNVYVGGAYVGVGNTSIRYIAPSNVITTVGLLTCQSNDFTDAFLSKFNSSGTYQYSYSVSNVFYGESINGVKCDSFDNVYFAGSAIANSNISYISNANVTTNVATLPSLTAAFCSKINSSGTYQYSLGIYRGSETFGNSVSTDYYGNMYLAGYYSAQSNIYFINNSNVFSSNLGYLPTPPVGGYAAYMVKVTANGTY